MYKVGIVDDDVRSREVVLRHLREFEKQHEIALTVHAYSDGDEFTKSFRPDYDVLFLDVQMPGMNGFDVARAVRERDEQVNIVFLTQHGELALRGYEVGALNYLVKPVPYFAFSQDLARSIAQRRKNAGRSILVATTTGAVRVEGSEIVYVESNKHRITIRTHDEPVTFSGTLNAVESELGEQFFRINSCYLVNLRHVRSMEGYSCTVSGGEVLRISRARRRPFLDALARYVDGSRR